MCFCQIVLEQISSLVEPPYLLPKKISNHNYHKQNAGKISNESFEETLSGKANPPIPLERARFEFLPQ